MKQVKVKTKYDEIIDYIMLETLSDVAQYANIIEGRVGDAVHRLFMSKVHPDRWDHMITKNDPGGVLCGAVMSAKAKGTNPLYEVGPLVSKKIASMIQMVAEGEILLVNKNGGYCPFVESYHTILEVSEFFETKPDTVYIKQNTKYINLENDPELEKRTIEYLSEKDPNYSYVLNLRNYNVAELVKVFTKFKQHGGSIVYVYTTGLDVGQMNDYSAAIVESGITNVEFEFNSGKTEEQDDVIAYLEKHKVYVKVISDV